MLKELLYADLMRQYELEGQSARIPGFGAILLRLFHPRFLPIVIFRVAQALSTSHFPLFPQVLTYMNIVLFGLEITPRCDIGPGLFLPHTTGTVIGARRIGKNATIYQNVTLGAKVLDMEFKPELRPEICDDVTLGAGCKVLGGITIGHGVIVGANSVVLKSVSPYSVVAGVPAQTITCAQIG